MGNLGGKISMKRDKYFIVKFYKVKLAENSVQIINRLT